MSEILVRRARLDDTTAICRLFRSQIALWQRLDQDGRVEDVVYDDLSIHERWLHGGPWLSVETGAIFLSHLLRGAGVPLVAVQNHTVCAYTELYPGHEPEPFGKHMHIGHLIVAPDCTRHLFEAALLHHAAQQARQYNAMQVTLGLSGYDETGAERCAELGLAQLAEVGRCNISAHTGQGFYRATDHIDANADQIRTWHMTVGRSESARYHWENLWPPLWNAVEEIVAQRTHRLRVSASGQEALICCQQHLYAPRTADIYCWSPKALSPQLLNAIRDWAHREGYRTLSFVVNEATRKVLGADVEPIPYRQMTYAAPVSSLLT